MTHKEREALKSVRGGADIFSLSLARTLRDIEKHESGLVTITKAMGDYQVDKPRPYFGAILTGKGKKALTEA